MKTETFQYVSGAGWSTPSFPTFDSERTLVLIFGASEFLDAPGPVLELTTAYPNSHLIGCSTSGEIFGTEISDRGLAVAVVQFEEATLQHLFVPISAAADSFMAGEQIATQLKRQDLRAVMVLAEGLNVNGSELVRGINSVLPDSVVVTGGLAGDGDRFQKTWVLRDGVPHDRGVSAAGLYGDSIHVGHGSRGGWDSFGPQRSVTKSEGNVVLEFDGQPALELYKKYLGERAAELPASGLLFPLALYPDDEGGRTIVRTILAVDESRQSLTFAGDVPEGIRAQFMKANFDRLVEGAYEAARLTQQDARESAQLLSVAISCVGRRLVLGQRAEEETEATLEVLPAGTKQVGFYSYGEISPYASGYCDLHNQTMTLTTITEV